MLTQPRFVCGHMWSTRSSVSPRHPPGALSSPFHWTPSLLRAPPSPSLRLTLSIRSFRKPALCQDCHIYASSTRFPFAVCATTVVRDQLDSFISSLLPSRPMLSKRNFCSDNNLHCPVQSLLAICDICGPWALDMWLGLRRDWILNFTCVWS